MWKYFKAELQAKKKNIIYSEAMLTLQVLIACL